MNIITQDAKVLAGTPIITGTRMPVSKILTSISGGESIQGIAESYGLRNEEVIAAIDFAAEQMRNMKLIHVK